MTRSAYMMIDSYFVLLCVLCGAAVAVEPKSRDSDAAFKVGFAMQEITPPVGWRRAGGYTELVSTGVHDPLMAKAMVIEDGVTSFAFVGNDLTAVPRDLSDRARKLASERTGIPTSNIIITATHTHGGPEYFGPMREFLHARALNANGGRDPQESVDWRSQIVEHWADVITRAWQARQSANLKIVIPLLEGMAFNRRFQMKDGSLGWNPKYGDPQIFRPAGPVDADFPFLVARAVEGEAPLGSLAVFAMHTAIYGGPEFGADFPGILQSELSATFGAKFVSIFGEGCAGDVNHHDPMHREREPWQKLTPAIGKKMAALALACQPQSASIHPGTFAVASTTIRSPAPQLTEAEYQDARHIMETLDENRLPFLTLVDAYRKVLRKEVWDRYGGELPQEVQAVRFDADTALVTLPHEIFVELGMSIKAASPFKRTIVVSLANDMDFYIPTRRAFEEGNYEPTTCPLEPGCGERLVAAAVKLLHELKPILEEVH